VVWGIGCRMWSGSVPSAVDMLNAYHALALHTLRPAEKTRAYDAMAALVPLCRDPKPVAVVR
jgi:hypothetical protein